MEEETKNNIEKKEIKYPSNSHKSKARLVRKEEKEIKRITVGKVIKQKKSIGKRMTEMIVGDNARSVAEYIFQDVIILAAKRMICEMVGWGGAAEMILFGEKSSRNSRRDSNRRHTPYNEFSYRSTERNYRDNDRRDISGLARSRHDFDEVIFDSRGDAEDVLSGLKDLIKDFGQATVRDFYDLSGITADFTDEKYGWIELKEVHISRVREGFIINFPRTRLLD